MDSKAHNTLMKTNRSTEVWTHSGSRADKEVDKTGTEGQVWDRTGRRQAARQTDMETCRRWTEASSRTGT
ncbi:hypothetical protein V3C99_003585 [Haemonchus contortus]